MTPTRFSFSRAHLWIQGQPVEGESLFPSLNPATGEPLGEAWQAGAEHLDRAVAAAVAAFERWHRIAPEERSRWFRRLRELLLDRAEAIARLLALEQGKPVAEALAVELLPTFGLLTYLEQEAPRLLKPRRITPFELLFADKTMELHPEPLGPVLIISPWNYPWLLAASAVLAALAAGNAVVWKPSPLTPLVAEALAQWLHDAGLPEGLVNVVHGGGTVGAALVTRPEFRLIHFTGSTETGRRIMAAAAPSVTPLVLELGGKDPMVVFADASLERAAQGAVWAAFMNAGQTCSSVERVYVERSVYADFVDRVVNLTRALKVGDPLAPDTDLGPLSAEFQWQKVQQQVEEARHQGARVLTGGGRPEGLSRGFFYAPTVLTEVPLNARVLQEETFGPVMPIVPFDTEEEALRLANATPYGLTASVWTRDPDRARRVARGLRAGTVTVNDHTFSYAEPRAPWGGIGDSGYGRSHGELGLLAFCHLKLVADDFTRRTRQLWWYPYGPELYHLLREAAPALYHPRRLARVRALLQLVRHHFPALQHGLSLASLVRRGLEWLHR